MISVWDSIIILGITIFIIVYALKKSKNLTLDDYWVNARKTKKFILICSMLSTSIGAGTVVTIVNMSHAGGFIGGILGFCNAVGLLLLGIFFASKLRKISFKHKCYTMGDVLHLRFNQNCRWVIGGVILCVYFFFLATQILAFGIFISAVTNWNYAIAIIVASLFVFIYVSVGGLKSDFITDFFQFFLILILIIVLPIFLFMKFDSFASIISSLAKLPMGFLTGTSYAGSSFVIGALLFFTPSIIVMMDAWQRIFAAESEESARKSIILSGFMIFPLFFMFSLIGVLGFILFPNIDPNLATPVIITKTLPVGLVGLAFSGFFAALMSTADSMLIVGSTTFVKDFYASSINKKSNDEHLLKISKATSIFIGLVSLAVALAFPNVVRVAISGFSTLIILIPGVIGGLLWKKATSKACFWSILAGFGFVILTLLFLPQYADYAFMPGFILSSVVFFVVSFVTKHDNKENINLWYDK